MNNTEVNQNEQSQKLTKFNEVIQIQVSLDSIAEQLLEKMDKSYPHAALLVNTIIGQAKENGRQQDISRIFNAMNGHVDKLDFELNTTMYCGEDVYDYMEKPEGCHRRIGPCVITGIKPLKDHSQIEISYTKVPNRRDTETKMDTKWVYASSLRQLTSEDVEKMNELTRAFENRFAAAASEFPGV